LFCSSDESAKAKPKKKKDDAADGTKSADGTTVNGAQKSDADSAAATPKADGSAEIATSNPAAGTPKTTAGSDALPPFNVLASFQNSQSPTGLATPPPSAGATTSATNVVDLTESDDVLGELGQIGGAGRSSRKSSRPSTPVKKMLSSGIK